MHRFLHLTLAAVAILAAPLLAQTRATGPAVLQQPATRIPAPAATATAAAQSAQSPTSLLICRGGEVAGLPRTATRPDGKEFHILYFRPARTAVAADGAGLAPGECSFTDRAIPGASSIVQFVTEPAGAGSADEMLAYLQSATRYWSFQAQPDAFGYFTATSHQRWMPSVPLTAATAPRANVAQAEELEIRCRGGGLRPASRVYRLSSANGRDSMQLDIVRSAGNFDSALAPIGPGTCTPAARDWSDADPLAIEFTTPAPPPALASSLASASAGRASQPETAATRPNSTTIPLWLAEPDHYWRFFVRRQAGKFVASRHEIWIPPAPRVAGNRNTPDATREVAKLMNVRVTPVRRGVDLRFSASPNSIPIVQLSKHSPVRAPNGVSALREPIALQVTREPANGNDAITSYRASTSRLQLDPHVQYHWLITVNEEGRALQQRSGEFFSAGRRLTAYFDSIRIIDDSDDATLGEGWFAFNILDWETQYTNRVDYDSGTTLRANRTLVVPDFDHDSVWVQVDGHDDDIFIAMGELLPGGSPHKFGGHTSESDFNLAKGEIRFDRSLGEQTIPFTIRSEGDHALQFEATGFVTIENPREAVTGP